MFFVYAYSAHRVQTRATLLYTQLVGPDEAPRLFRERGLLRHATDAGWRVKDHGRPAKYAHKNSVLPPHHPTAGNVVCNFHSSPASDHTFRANNSDIVGQYSQEIYRQLKPIAESDDFILILGGTTALPRPNPFATPWAGEPQNPSDHTLNHARMQATTPYHAAHCRLSELRVRLRVSCGSAL